MLKERLIEYRQNNPNVWAKRILDDDLLKDLLEYDEFKELSIQMKAAAIILGEIPICECGNQLKFDSKQNGSPYSTPFGRWLEFCSTRCARTSLKTVEKRKSTMLERYGETSWAKTREGRESASAPWSDEKKTNYKTKYKQTVLSKYGVEHFSKTPEYLNKRSATILEKTNGKFSNCFQDVNAIKVSCIEKYGVDSWKKTKEGKAASVINNPMKNRETIEKSRLIRMSNAGRYDKTLLSILISNDKVAFKKYIDEIAINNKFDHRQSIAKHLSISYSFLNALFRRFGMTNEYLSLGTSKSYKEQELCDFIDSLGIRYKRGDRTVLEGREIDILIEEKKFGIEFNGIYYHSEFSGGKDKDYHLSKTELAELKGYQLLHIFETEWDNLTKREILKSMIKAKLGLIKNKIYARNCSVQEISSEKAKCFLDQNHLSGFIGSKIHFGLYNNEELVAVLSYGKSRFKSDENEIHRFAVKTNTIIIGAFGKLFNHIPKDNLVSYADRRISGVNSVYNKFFNTREKTTPNWFGFQVGTSNLLHRLSFTKKKLSKMFDYDETKTVTENMFDNGYDRIWDCGNWKFSNSI